MTYVMEMFFQHPNGMVRLIFIFLKKAIRALGLMLLQKLEHLGYIQSLMPLKMPDGNCALVLGSTLRHPTMHRSGLPWMPLPEMRRKMDCTWLLDPLPIIFPYGRLRMVRKSC